MTSPAKRVGVECPNCGHHYEDWYRPSVNLDLDDFSERELEEATSGTCPHCGHRLPFNSLLTERSR